MNSVLRVGVVGAGHFGSFHARKLAANPRVALVGVHDLDEGRAAALGAEAGGAPSLPVPALLEAADAIIIATPADTHFDIARAVLAAGRHALIEKPMAATLEQADELAALSRRHGLVLQVGHLLRYSAEHHAIAARISRPLYIEATRIAPFKPRGTDVSVILDLMIHDLDLVLSLVDIDIESVDAVGAAVSSAFEDIANARVRFANGCVATITASRISLKTERKMRLFSQEGYLSVDFVARHLTMIGRERGLPVPGAEGFMLDQASWQDHDVLEAEHAAFIASCLDGAPVLVDASAGRRALAAALAVADSMARSRAQAERSGLVQNL